MASGPLTPRRGAEAIEKGDAQVEVILNVDPPTVSGATIKGGDAGLSKLTAAIDKREDRSLSLTIFDNMKSHHIDILSRVEFKKPLNLSLELRNNNVLSYNQAGYPAKWKSLFTNESLTIESMDLSGNTMEDTPPPKCFLEPMIASTDLRSVTLRHLRTTIEGADIKQEYDECLAALVKSPSLTSIDVTHNELNEVDLWGEGGIGVNVTKLYLSWNDLPGSVLHSLCLNNKQVASQLTVLHFGRNLITDVDHKVLVAALRSMRSLQELELNDNNLPGNTVQAIVNSVSRNISYLGLHGNSFGDAVLPVNFPKMKNALMTLVNLTTLDISSNNVAAAGLGFISSTLMTLYRSRKLTKLIVSNNNLGCNTDILKLHVAGLRVDAFMSVTQDLYDFLKLPTPPKGWTLSKIPTIKNGALHPPDLEATINLTKYDTAETLYENALDLQRSARKSPITVFCDSKSMYAFGKAIAESNNKIIITKLETGLRKKETECLTANITVVE